MPITTEQAIRAGKMGGRPKGRRPEKVIERDRIHAEVKNRIAKNAQRILNAQMSLAQGLQFLFKIHTEKGKRDKPVLVTNEQEIQDYLDGKFEDSKEDYYYITTEKPDNQAIKDMLDRTFGRPKESLEHSGEVSLKIDL